MTRTPRFELRLTVPARRDIAAILKKSLQAFGKAASVRYEMLIQQALTDIAVDPFRPGSTERPEIMIEGARTYHLEFSRTNVIGRRVKEPRHILLYRHLGDSVIEVARLLHDSRDLKRHLPPRFRNTD